MKGVQAIISNDTPEEAPEAEKEMEGLIIEEVDTGIHFKVQILTSSKSLDKGEFESKGIGAVEELKVRRLFKYFAGRTSSFEEAKKNQSYLRELGYEGAFVVAFEGKEQIGLADAIRKTK